MRQEYETIARGGLVLQIDCPDLGMGRHIQYADLSLAGLAQEGARCTSRRSTTRLRNIPPEQLRMHLCWGNYEGPHHCDVPLADVIDIVFKARPAGDLARGGEPAPRARVDGCSRPSSCPTARC